jgi:predicted transposase YdaD
MTTRSMISFDWAMKRLLRQKANFEVLEGFLSELLSRKIIIKHLGESESNPTNKDDKTNRVDIFVEADDKELVIIELQYDDQIDYFQRMLYGVSKSIAEHIYKGEPYSKVRKVYSVNICYFDLGKGDDYVYRGFTNFRGLHTNNELELSEEQQKFYGKTLPGDLCPEYYLILIRRFENASKDKLDEWIYYLKNNKIRDDFTAQGLDKAREILAYDNLSDTEKQEYSISIESNRIKQSEIETALFKGRREGREEGREEGKKEGREEGRIEKALIIAKNLLKKDMSIEDVCDATGLSKQQVKEVSEH